MTETHATYRFGPFELDTAAYELRRDGEPIAVEPRALDVLVHLVRHRGRVVSRDELVDAVWPGSFISDSALGQSVLKARRAVDDDGRRQEVIRTVHGRGLRFVAEVAVVGPDEPSGEAASAEPVEEEARPAPARGRRWLLAAVAVAVVPAILVAAWWTLRQPATTGATRVALLPFSNQTGDPTLEWIEAGLPRLIGRALAERGGVEIVSDHAVTEALERTSRPGGVPLDDGGFAELTVATGTTHAVTAAVSREADLFRARLEIRQAGRRSRELDLTAPRVPQLLDAIAAAIGERVLPGSEDAPVRAGFSDDPFVNRLYAMGLAEYQRDNYRGAESYFRVCLDREPELQWARYELSLCQRRLGSWHESLELSREVLDAAVGADDWRLQAAVHHNMGLVTWRLGDLDAAEQHYLAAAAIADAEGMRDVRAPVLLSLGILWSDRGQLDRADSVERQALALYREMGDRSGEAAALNSLGVLAWRRGELATSREMHERALVIRRELGKREREAASLNNLGTIEQATGRWSAAESLFEQALAIRRELDDRLGQASTLYNLSVLALLRSDPTRSRELATESLEIARELGELRRAAWSLGQLSEVERRSGDLAEARRLSAEALELYRQLGDPQGEAARLLALGRIAVDAGDLAAATDRADQAREIANVLANRALEGQEAALRAEIARTSGDLDRAEELFRRALDAALEIGQSFDAMTAALALADVLLERRQVDEAGALAPHLEEFTAAGYAPATLVMARLRDAQGRSEEAAALAEQARATAGTLWTPGDEQLYLQLTRPTP